MILRVGPQLKPFNSYRRVRWREGAPAFWGIADQGGSMVDASDGRYACMNTGTVTLVAGSRGPALSVDGTTGNYISTPLQIQTLCAGGTGTVRFDYYSPRAPNDGQNHHVWAQVQGTDIGPEFSFQKYSDNNIYAGFNGGGIDSRVVLAATTANYPYLTWGTYHLTWASGGSTILYYNAAQVSTHGSTTIQSPAETLTIGHMDTSNFSANNGRYDSFAIYNYAFTPDQVLADYLDPWWRLRGMPPRWMGQGGAAPAATLFRRTLYRRTGSRGVA